MTLDLTCDVMNLYKHQCTTAGYISQILRGMFSSSLASYFVSTTNLTQKIKPGHTRSWMH